MVGGGEVLHWRLSEEAEKENGNRERRFEKSQTRVAASSNSRGTVSKNPLSIQTQSGSAVTQYASIKPRCELSNPRVFITKK